MRILLVANGTMRVRFEGNPVTLSGRSWFEEGRMRALGVVLRAIAFALLMTGLVRAEDVAVPEWQATVTGQIEAFRAHDAPGAFVFASAPFHTAFPSAEAFFVAIIGSGYGPIMESVSHSFGEFTQLNENAVAQEVMFTGKDLSRYEAIYVLTQEADGWRVSGVQLAKTPGLSI
jgi:hypothetical protein